MTPSKKLNIFQRGLLQKAVTFFAYLGSIVASALLLDWTDKRLFAATLEEASKRGVITPEVSSTLQMFIEGRDGTIIFAIIVVGISCVTICWLLMRWAAKRNWSWPVSLAKAIEFRAAMAQLGIIDPIERIDFVRKHKLPVFIALSPLIGKEQINVRAQYYAFAHDYSFGNNELFERHIGKQTLCLDWDDYENIAKVHGQKTDLAYSIKIVALEEDISSLKNTIFLQADDIAQLKTGNELLQKENATLKDKLKTVSCRNSRAETDTIRKIPFWRVAAPLINRLIAQADSETSYSRRDIQAAFEDELESFPGLKAPIKKALRAAKQNEPENEPENEFDLTGWAMEAIRAGLGKFVKTTPGRTSKS